MAMNLDERLMKIKVGLLINVPFFGNLLMNLELKPIKNFKSNRTKWGYTDGRAIYYNPPEIEKLRDLQIAFFLIHEVLHPAFGHLWRMGARNGLKWNYAADYKVNQTIEEFIAESVSLGKQKPCEFIDGVVVDRQRKFTDKSTEEVYYLLPDMEEEEGGCGWNVGDFQDPKDNEGQPGDDESQDGEGSGGSMSRPNISSDELKKFWEDAFVKAVESSRMQGKCPAFAERELQSMKKRPLPWRQLMQNFFTTVSNADYSYRKPNKKYFAHDLYMPTLHDNELGPVGWSLDTSGSTFGTELVDQAIDQFNILISICQPERVHYWEADDGIGFYKEFGYSELIPKNHRITGGGGTDFRHVFEKADLIPELVCLIYVTDLWGTFPSYTPNYPVLWIVPPSENNGHPHLPPFGQVIYLYE